MAYKMKKEMRERLRAAKLNLWTIPEDATPSPPNDQSKDQVWKSRWEEEVVVDLVGVERKQDQEGRAYDSWRLQLKVPDNAVDSENKGRVHNEFYTTYVDEMESGEYEWFTERSLIGLEELITNAGVEWELDEDGDEDLQLTFLKKLKGLELTVVMEQGKRWLKTKEEFKPYLQLHKVQPED